MTHATSSATSTIGRSGMFLLRSAISSSSFTTAPYSKISSAVQLRKFADTACANWHRGQIISALTVIISFGFFMSYFSLSASTLAWSSESSGAGGFFQYSSTCAAHRSPLVSAGARLARTMDLTSSNTVARAGKAVSPSARGFNDNRSIAVLICFSSYGIRKGI